MIQGAIFDMDGTLLDSMIVWDDLSQRFLKRWGIQVTKQDYAAIEGTTQLEGAQYFVDTYPELPLTAEGFVEGINEIITERYHALAKPKAGIVPFLDKLRENGVPMGIATLTAEHHARKALEERNMMQYFDFMLTIEDVGVSKRSPDIYLLSAERLGASTESCMVFEDAPYAAETAKNAGFQVCGVIEPFYSAGEPLLRAVSDLLVESSFDEVIARLP